MKKIALGLALMIAALVQIGCKKRAMKEFDLVFTADYLYAPGTTTVGLNKMTSQGGWSSTNVGAALDREGINGNIVGEMKVSRFDIKVKTPSTVKLSKNLNYDFYLVAGEQKKVRIANSYPDFGVATASLQTTASSTNTDINLVGMKIDNVNLKNYFLQPKVNMTLESWTDNLPTSTYTITADYTVHVTAIE
jgi:hypothetical protein